MSNGKMLVIGSCLKIDRPFKAATVTLMSGLSRQLVYQHLTTLCETGYLEKIDKHYIVRDREGLLTTLIEESENQGTSKPQPGGFYTKEKTDLFTQQADMIIAARTLGLPMSLDARQGYVDKLDASIKVLKQVRKYLTNSTKTVGSAQKVFKGATPEAIEAVWKFLAEYAGENATVDALVFEEAFKEAMVEE